MNQSYSIKDIIRLLLSHIWLIIVITVLGAGAAFGISKFLLPLQYSSHITMYVQSYTGITENANSVNNISNSKQLVNTYMEVLKDDAVMNAVAEKLSKQFDSDALGKKYNKAIIGDIQAFGDSKKKRDADDAHLKLTDKDAPFHIIESYKSIRTNLSFALSTVEKKTFAVSSANPGEGKSTTSANIAIAIAQSGSHVLLIDADMRKSVQHKIFELVNKKGLSTAVSKMHTPDECIQKNVMENLDVMTAGPIPPNPSELLASEAMEQMLHTLSEQYDVILIDTPPINVVTDAMELAKNISGIVLVVRYGKTTDEDVDNVFDRVKLANMNLLGFILNGVRSKHAGYYSKYGKGKYYYKKGYGYGYYGAKPELDTAEAKAETQGKD